MAAPCINNTCSIEANIDPVTRRLELDVLLGQTGGLECIDGVGLGVRLYGDVVANALVDTCYNQIGMFQGDIYSIPQRVRYKDFSSSGDGVGVPYTGAYSSNPIDSGNTITNPHACTALALVTGSFRLRYSIGDEATGALPANSITDGSLLWYPFHTNMQFILSVDNNVSNEEVQYQTISGMRAVTDTSAGDINDVWVNFAFTKFIGANASFQMYAKARHTESGGNVNRNINTDDYTNGFKCNGRVVIFPVNGDVIL